MTLRGKNRFNEEEIEEDQKISPVAGTGRQEDHRGTWLAAPIANEKCKTRVKHSWNVICTDGPGHTIAPGRTANGPNRATPCSRPGGLFWPTREYTHTHTYIHTSNYIAYIARGWWAEASGSTEETRSMQPEEVGALQRLWLLPFLFSFKFLA